MKNRLGLSDRADLYTLDEMNLDQLMSSAPLMWDWSRDACAAKARGGMEAWAKSFNGNGNGNGNGSGYTCDWYHGTWQLLRLLNMVAVPPWYAFYQDALTRILRAKPNADVLVSALADYGMLCTLHEAVVAAGASPTITVCDICETPLRSAQWYADRHGFEIRCIRDDLLTSPELPVGGFDLVVTDELLTVLPAEDKPRIVARWKEFLRTGGVVVTTAMIGAPTTSELRAGYAARARRLLDLHADRFQSSGATHDELIDRFERFAGYHTRHMLPDEEELRALFAGHDLEFTKTVTPGECVTPTSSFQIVASLGSRG